MNKIANIKEGDIYAIPLFVSDIPNGTSFVKKDYGVENGKFAYCRVIQDLGGGGILIEVFDTSGDLHVDISDIISSNRLFEPVTVSGVGIYKKRWKKIITQENYDKEKNSNYSDIKLVAGYTGNFQLWKGGNQMGKISKSEVEKYEFWTIWRSNKLEKRIIKSMSIKDK